MSRSEKIKSYLQSNWFMGIMLVIFMPIGYIFFIKNERISKMNKFFFSLLFIPILCFELFLCWFFFRPDFQEPTITLKNEEIRVYDDEHITERQLVNKVVERVHDNKVELTTKDVFIPNYSEYKLDEVGKQKVTLEVVDRSRNVGQKTFTVDVHNKAEDAAKLKAKNEAEAKKKAQEAAEKKKQDEANAKAQAELKTNISGNTVKHVGKEIPAGGYDFIYRGGTGRIIVSDQSGQRIIDETISGLKANTMMYNSVILGDNARVATSGSLNVDLLPELDNLDTVKLNKAAIETSSEASAQAYIDANTKTLPSGRYEIGVDYVATKYDFELVSGKGNMSIYKPKTKINKNYTLPSKPGTIFLKDTYLENGDFISIPDDVVVKMIPKTDINKYKQDTQKLDGYRKQMEDNASQLAAGTYTAGNNFVAWRYDITVVKGTGTVKILDAKGTELVQADVKENPGTPLFDNYTLSKGMQIVVDGTAEVKIRPRPNVKTYLSIKKSWLNAQNGSDTVTDKIKNTLSGN